MCRNTQEGWALKGWVFLPVKPHGCTTHRFSSNQLHISYRVVKMRQRVTDWAKVFAKLLLEESLNRIPGSFWRCGDNWIVRFCRYFLPTSFRNSEYLPAERSKRIQLLVPGNIDFEQEAGWDRDCSKKDSEFENLPLTIWHSTPVLCHILLQSKAFFRERGTQSKRESGTGTEQERTRSCLHTGTGTEMLTRWPYG